MTIDPKTLDLILHRGVAEIIVEEEFVALLKAEKPLRLKMGFDPSSPDIHIGHAVGLRKLRQLQDIGHQVVLIVGDWTARIGDPSGQSAQRRMMSQAEVEANAETYMRQFFKIIDRSRTEARYQSEWFGSFDLEQVIGLTSRFTVAQFLAREDFGKRFREGRPIAITELLYPLLQAYDSVKVESDVEFGGTDQKFNLLVGRDLQIMEGQLPQQCFLMPILVGTDGVQKMSKSLDNYVGVEEPPDDMFGKLMSIPDEQIIPYFEYLTDVPQEQLDDLARDLSSQTTNPMAAKKDLANQITATFHGQQAADAARDNFERVVQGRDLPEDIPEFSLAQLGDGSLPQLSRLLVTTGLASSNAAAKRLISQRAVELVRTSGESYTFSADTPGDSPGLAIQSGDVIKVGKRRFLRLVWLDC
ncbi:MAG: tyrosine--tRNA ligase, partial [Chloroflexi bacterium]|nr:tyrosine--tRNA ligase [Chloroflexota bacterium]